MSAVAPTELFSLVVAGSWRTAWLILLLVALRRLVRGRIPAQVWFLAWIVVAVRLLVPVSFPTTWSPYNLTAKRVALPEAVATPQPVTTVAAAPLPAVAVSAEMARAAAVPAVSVETERAVAPQPLPARPRVFDFAKVAAVVWLAGVGVLLSARLIGSWRFRRQLARAKPVADTRVDAVIAEEAGGRAVRGLETDAVDAPALYGIFRSRLLFPPNFVRVLDDDELRLVVRHELAHWRRRDLLAQALMQGAVALHWFNPLVWLAAWLARTDCELACDEFVLRRESAAGASAYGATLLKVLGMVRGRRRPSPVVTIIEGKQQLAQRVRMIAAYRASTVLSVGAGLALVIGLATASLTREAQAAGEGQPAVAPRPAVSATPAPIENTVAPRVSSPERENERDEISKLHATIEVQRNQVQRLARALLEFREKNRLVSLDQARDMANDALKAANQELIRSRQMQAAMEVQLRQVQEFRARKADLTTLSFVANAPEVGELKQQVAHKTSELRLLSEKYLERHPLVISAANDLEETERRLERAIDSACKRLETEFAAVMENQTNALRNFEQRTQESLNIERLAVAYSEKERDLRAQEEVLQRLVAREMEPAASGVSRETASPGNDGFTVSVMGAVRQPGAVFFARDERPILLDVIARAGGFVGGADRGAVKVVHVNPDGSRSTDTVSFAEERLMDGAGAGRGVSRGDVVVVPELRSVAEPKSIAVLGAVASPGRFAFPAESGARLTVVDVLAKAGGATPIANLKKVRIKRTQRDGAMTSITIDVAEFLAGSEGTNVELEPGDVVFVPEKII